MRNYRIAGLVLWFVLVVTYVHGQDTLILDKIIAKVGGEVIFYSDLESEMVSLREHKMPAGKNEACTMLESLLAQAMMVHYAKIDSIQVSEDEVNSEIDQRMDQILAYMNNDRKRFQEVYGQTVSEMRDQVREDMERKLQGDRMQAKIMENVDVTPSEVIEFYNSVPKDSLPYFNAEVELAELVMTPKVNAEEKIKALDKITKILQQVRAGEDFASLARKYSDDGSAKVGGDLDWTVRGSFVPEFEAAAFQLEKDQVSEVIETEYGYHIIQLLDRRGNSIHTRHILIRPRITDIDKAKTKTTLDSIRRLVEMDSLTFAQAVLKFGDKKVQSYSNNGRMINPKTNNTFFETADVDPEIFFSIDTLSVGEITPPLEYRSPIGDNYYKIVQLQSRSKPHQANLQQDYSRIQEIAKVNKKNFAFSEWIEKHIPNTFIMIDSYYQYCPNIDRWQPKWMGTNRS
ncbi:MAG TPA: peptidylprolyl isomerase [Saprospiraceae bacterium]|nr:peptidylprolyl isomerase [Saprospiraceae bacterium]